MLWQAQVVLIKRQLLMYGLIAAFAVLDVLCLFMLLRKRFGKKSDIHVEVQG